LIDATYDAEDLTRILIRKGLVYPRRANRVGVAYSVVISVLNEKV
jgi:hypothetical protein